MTDEQKLLKEKLTKYFDEITDAMIELIPEEQLEKILSGPRSKSGFALGIMAAMKSYKDKGIRETVEIQVPQGFDLSEAALRRLNEMLSEGVHYANLALPSQTQLLKILKDPKVKTDLPKKLANLILSYETGK